jgi:hypothetical protein
LRRQASFSKAHCERNVGPEIVILTFIFWGSCDEHS